MSDTRKLSIYIDGSCEENRNVNADTLAGWGFCVVLGDSGLGKGQGEILTEKYGKVVTDPNETDFIGAEVGSNNTAELSALAHALRWCLSQSDAESVVIRGDSTYALNVGSGEWRAKANRQLAEFCQKLWKEVSGILPLSKEHVRAHRGHRWNERADHLAFRAMSGEAPLPLQFWKPGVR